MRPGLSETAESTLLVLVSTVEECRYNLEKVAATVLAAVK